MNVVARDIHTIDAQGQVPGRLATRVAHLLMGKHKSAFAPNKDQGDHVQVVNASKMRVNPKKLTQKVYYHHTMYASGLKTKTLKQVFDQDPADVLRRAVSRMLPKNRHRSERLKRLVVKN